VSFKLGKESTLAAAQVVATHVRVDYGYTIEAEFIFLLQFSVQKAAC
jgi:hypothetical protein